MALKSERGELFRLLGRARRGEPGALDELIGQVRPLVSAWARAACPQRSEAEDVLQESLLELYRSISRLREEKAFLPWLRRLVRNNAADRGRRRATRREVPLEEAARQVLPGAVGSGPEGRERRRLLLAAMAELGEEEREMLTLRHEAGLSLAEIAAATGQSPRAVESRLFRARRALRGKLSGRAEL